MVGRPPSCLCGECQKCKHRDYMRQWYRKKTPDERRAWIAKRDIELVRARDRERWQRDKGKRVVLIHNYIARYPEKASARKEVGRAIRAGTLSRGPCEVCGFDGRTHAHHDDYSKPLDVRWLCQRHHTEQHKDSLPRKADVDFVR